MLIDAHVHPSLFSDPAQVYRQAQAAGIMLVGMSCSLQDSRILFRLSEQFDAPACLGIHPWYAQSEQFPPEFAAFLSHPNLLGVGECGLDFQSPLPLKAQERLLEQELDFACGHELMVSLHVRKKHAELCALLRRYQGRLKGMLHNFTFSRELARSYLDLNLLLSIGSHILKRTPKMCEVIRYVGIEHLLLETDSDGSHSGPDQPDLLVAEYEVLAEILKLTVSKVQERLWQNFQTLKAG